MIPDKLLGKTLIELRNLYTDAKLQFIMNSNFDRTPKIDFVSTILS